MKCKTDRYKIVFKCYLQTHNRKKMACVSCFMITAIYFKSAPKKLTYQLDQNESIFIFKLR